jgi:hypothetical protein
MIWFLVIGIYGCHSGANAPSACYYRDQRLSMPSLEICRSVRDWAGGKCISEMVDGEQENERGRTTIFPSSDTEK